jgi:hypothetical protein
MTRRDAAVGAVGALACAAVLVSASLWHASGSVDVASGQGAHLDPRGPRGTAATAQDSEAAGASDPWRAANANLVDQVRAYQRRFEESEAQTRRISTELDGLKAKLAALEPDAAEAADPFNPSPAEWKELAKANIVRAKNFCFPPPDWQPDAEQLASLGLAPGDTPALTKALADASQRMWHAVGAACAKIVGSTEVAERLGNETCGTIIQRSVTPAVFSADTQLVADIRAGNRPMPPPGQIDGVTARLLAMTSAASDLEKDLTASLGPDEARRIAYGDMPWGCALQFGGPGSDVSPQLGQGTQ